MRRCLCICVALCLTASLARAAAKPPIRLASHESGSTLRCPVPLLRGELSDAKATSVVVVNTSSKRDTREMKVLALRGAAMDQENAVADLKAGENTLVAEVSNGIGGWGLFLRFEDTKGDDLTLAPDGALTSFRADPATEQIRLILKGRALH